MQRQTTVKIDRVKGPREQQNREKEGRWDVQMNAWFLMERSRGIEQEKGRNLNIFWEKALTRRGQSNWWSGGCIRAERDGRYGASIERLGRGGGVIRIERSKIMERGENKWKSESGQRKEKIWHPKEVGNKIELMFHALERFVTQL